MLKRIIMHWTAGQYTPTAYEKRHYHFLIDSNGNIYRGFFEPKANENCKKGQYAPHTGGGNTGSIGIALCGMANFNPSSNQTPFPITQIQLETALSLVAALCLYYKIPVSSDTVMTHYEFGLKNPSTSSKGKIDITFLPTAKDIKPDKIGDFLRGKVSWYIQKHLLTINSLILNKERKKQ